MSTFTKAGNFLHDQLLNGVGTSAMSHISAGAGLGAFVGGGSALATGNDSVMGGIMGGAVQGAVLGAGSKYASMQYAKGVANFVQNTVDPATKQVFSGVKESLVKDVSNFKFGHFTAPNTNNIHANYWHPDANVFKQTPFGEYNPRFTPPADGSKVRRTGIEMDPSGQFINYK